MNGVRTSASLRFDEFGRARMATVIFVLFIPFLKRDISSSSMAVYDNNYLYMYLGAWGLGYFSTAGSGL
jgi:hypothetical protein